MAASNVKQYTAEMDQPPTLFSSATAHERFVPSRIVSGGQTGVDRGALDAAIALGIPHGGWCPLGRLAEDGPVPQQYLLDELDSAYYPDRTAKNVVDSDATLILYRGTLSGGTALTQRICRREGKPFLSMRIDNPKPARGGDTATARDQILNWLAVVRPEALNVAGPRETNAVGIQDETRALMMSVLG